MSAGADVLDEGQVRRARDTIVETWGRVDALVNAAGGNVARARNDSIPIFDVPMDAFDEVLRLNLHGSVIPSLVFAETMAAQKSGSIVCVSSMAASHALSGVLGYSVAKSGIENFTRWMGTELARKFGEGIRVNAISPGFFVSTQNRSVLVTDDGHFTARGRVDHRSHPDGTLRSRRGAGGGGALAVQRRGELRDRGRGADRRRLQRVQRDLAVAHPRGMTSPAGSTPTGSPGWWRGT